MVPNMTWQNLVGHQQLFDRFLRSHQNNRLANTYLFVGPEGIGKKQFALNLAKALFCRQAMSDLVPCGACPNCLQVANLEHPDLILVSKPEDKNFIPVELFLGDREHRRRKGLCHDIHLTPFAADRKVAIIDDADYLNAESANSLLKTLEEPPPNSLLILIGTSEHRQLPTILSRAQVVRFQALSNSDLKQVLSSQPMPREVDLEKLINPSAGSVSRALLLDNESLFAFRGQLLGQLMTSDPAQNGFAKSVCDFVEGISKESSVRRQYLRLIADFTIQTCSEVIRCEDETDSNDAHQLRTGLDANGRATEVAADWIDRTISFQRQVDANMAMANIVPHWLNDLGAIARQEKVLA